MIQFTITHTNICFTNSYHFLCFDKFNCAKPGLSYKIKTKSYWRNTVSQSTTICMFNLIQEYLPPISLAMFLFFIHIYLFHCLILINNVYSMYKVQNGLFLNTFGVSKQP